MRPTELLRALKAPLIKHTAGEVTIRAKLAVGAMAVWWPAVQAITDAVTAPALDDLDTAVSVLQKFGVAPDIERWRHYAGQQFVEIAVAKSKLVSDKEALVTLRGDPLMLDHAVRGVIETLVTSSMAAAVIDVTQHCSRLSVRLGEDTAWIERCAVIDCHDAYSEFVASTLLNQRPQTPMGAVFAGTVSGVSRVIGSRALGGVADAITMWRRSAPDETLFWQCDSAHALELAMQEDCVPIVPADRDVTIAMKFAGATEKDTRLRRLTKQIAFLAQTSAEAKQGFSSLASVGIAPSSAIAVMSLAHHRPMSCSVIDTWCDNLNALDAVARPDKSVVQSVIVT